MGDLVTSLRALAHPGSVLALVLLVLNDHLLKQAWPGWVTGKLSDVAGLVVAPLLLASLLPLVRTPRAMPVALVATGAGFVLCKTSEVGAALTSSVWSVFGTPTMIRADVTDLLALPALYVAWRIHRTARAAAGPGWRRTVAVAVGTALLPVGVLATSATSCAYDDGVDRVDAIAGRFTGTEDSPLFVVSENGDGVVRMDPVTGAVADLSEQDARRLPDDTPFWYPACDTTGMMCWRVEDQVVERSVDGGTTWIRDLVVSEEERTRSVEGVDPGCGEEASAMLGQVAVIDRHGDVSVAVGARHAGVWLRYPDGEWRLRARDELAARPVDDPVGPVQGRLRWVYVPPARSDEGWRDPAPPTPSCDSPTQRTVTPHPLNGPPTTYEVCPDGG